jgi:signal transduction histidine kinase
VKFEPALRGYLEGVERESPPKANALIRDYALETYLVRRASASRVELTGIGRVFLQLRGKEAIRWLLTNEVVQSMGNRDPWRAPQNFFEWLVESEIGVWSRVSFYSIETIERLVSVGLVMRDPLQEDFGCLVEEMRDVARAVSVESPWHAAIRALLDDARALAIPGLTATATESNIEQTKLIVHEVRNALIPVRHDIDALRSLPLEATTRQRIDNARDGVVRVLDFVDSMAQASELITEQPSSFELFAVMSEALSWVDTTRRVEMKLPLVSWRISAPRTRLARAISNVVGNALQATGAGQPVRVSVKRTRDILRIAVDDGGPGVPIEHRQRVFTEGVTMRKDGAGSGFGLAFARRVVEDSLHGRIWCEDSDLGGARFVIELPQPPEPTEP